MDLFETAATRTGSEQGSRMSAAAVDAAVASTTVPARNETFGAIEFVRSLTSIYLYVLERVWRFFCVCESWVSKKWRKGMPKGRSQIIRVFASSLTSTSNQQHTKTLARESRSLQRIEQETQPTSRQMRDRKKEGKRTGPDPYLGIWILTVLVKILLHWPLSSSSLFPRDISCYTIANLHAAVAKLRKPEALKHCAKTRQL